MHLFAGGGGGLLADLILGHKPIIAVEWEPYACQILRERAADGWFPDLQVWEGDVRLFDPSEYAGRVDCIHAGFPCQDISVAGKQAGLGEGTRSGLYREVLRIAGIVKPRYLFLENVSAIVNLGLGTVIADLSAMGYDCKWLTLRASDVGAPHHRDRWWCLCTRVENSDSTRLEKYGMLNSNIFERSSEAATSNEQSEIEGDVRNTEHDGQPTAEVCGSLASGSDDNQTGPQQAEQPARPSEQSADVADTGSAGRELNELNKTSANWQSCRPISESSAVGGKQYVDNSNCEGLEGPYNDTKSSERIYTKPCERCAEVAEKPCEFCGYEFDHELLGKYGCPNCEGEGCTVEPDLGQLAYELATPLDANQALQSWWKVEPQVGRVTTGCENRAAQLKALGNGQVPLQAAVAWVLLGGDCAAVQS